MQLSLPYCLPDGVANMHAEHLEILGFLSQYSPFKLLPEDVLERLSADVEVTYARAGSDVLKAGDAIDDLYVIRSGSVEVFRRDGELYNRLAEGAVFGQMGLLMNRRVRFPVRAMEDTLFYCVRASLFDELCAQYDDFADFFEVVDSAVLRQVVSAQNQNNDLTTAKVKSLISGAVETVSELTSIRAAAQVMSDANVSSLMITAAENGADCAGDVVGILTDRNLRERVVAQGCDIEAPVKTVMSGRFLALDDNAYVFEAMLTMLRENIQHLPILKAGKTIGVLGLSDIVRYESQSSLLFVQGVFAQQSIDDLAHYAKGVASVFLRMVNEDANSHMIGSAMSVIGRSFKKRMITLAEERLGPPPVPYCFLALGSMARDEQLMVTDQDNALILDDSFDAEQQGAYFEQLAEIVCQGLAACGYSLCSGDIMATNPKWRLTKTEWRNLFKDWIDNPDPQALLNSSIFFDLDGVWGEEEWARELHQFVVDNAKGSPRFLACLARNALNRTPPLGFFRGFVMEHDGRHRHSINLKRRGTAPLSDLIRVHALAVGSKALNSFDRLDDVIAAELLPPGKGQELSDALEYISMVRIRYQARELEAGEEPDNSIEPGILTNFERRNLKEAFQVLSVAQSFLKFRYRAGRSLQ